MSNSPKNEELSQRVGSQLASDDLSWLTEPERYAYDYFLTYQNKGGANTFPISEATAEKIFNLYLHGRTFAEIRALNPTIGLGQLIAAAITGNWRERREEWLSTSVEHAKTRAVQAITEGVELAADMMAAVSKLHKDNLAKFLQTGDIAFLTPAEGTPGPISKGTIAQLKELASLLGTLTGQDKKTTTNFIVPPQPPSSLDVEYRPASTATKRIAQLAAAKKASEK